MLPKRRQTREQDRAHRINTERRHNHDTRTARQTRRPSYFGLAPPDTDTADPPPF
jgi:hypothetical protein